MKLDDMKVKIRRALSRYPLASLTMLRGVVQSNHAVVSPAATALIDEGEVTRISARPFSRQADRLYLTQYREQLLPFLDGRDGHDYGLLFQISDDPYAREHAEGLARIIEALSLYPVLTRWALCNALGSSWDWVKEDLTWLREKGIVASYTPGSGDRRRAPRYYLAQHAALLAPFLEEKNGAVLQGA